MNNPLSIGFLLLGLIMIIGGIIWISRLSLSEEDDKKPANDDEKLINVGFGEYNTEGLVMFRGIAAIIVGIIFLVVGILI
jgi:uncharacterized membrane protein HdeD (DUF308 family)